MTWCWKWKILQKMWSATCWRHQMETFPRYWPFVRRSHRSPVNSPRIGQWRGALMFSLICAWINDWANNRDASDLRGHRAHYDVAAMKMLAIGSGLNMITVGGLKEASFTDFLENYICILIQISFHINSNINTPDFASLSYKTCRV